LFGRIRRLFLGAYAGGSNKTTPVESLNLQPGELVEVRPIENIVETLNEAAHNRGLWFSPDMRLLCGKRQQVARRIDKLIVDGTGEMRQLRNTGYLEGSTADVPTWRSEGIRAANSSIGGRLASLACRYHLI